MTNFGDGREERLDAFEYLTELNRRRRMTEKQKMSVSKTITKYEFLQVVGLLTVAKQQLDALEATEKALSILLDQPMDESGYAGHVSDAVYSRYSAEQLLGRLEIVVE